MTCPNALNKVLWRARLKGVTPEPMIRSTEYSAVSSVLVALLVSVFMTVTGFGTVGMGVGALVAAGTVATGLALATAALAGAAVAAGIAAVVAAGSAAVVAAGIAAVATAAVEGVAVAAEIAADAFVGGV